jgi:anthranilate 1,2-dioxygenase small subunit
MLKPNEAHDAPARSVVDLSELSLWFELVRLQDRYVATIDDNRLEQWPELFLEDAVYEIVPKENVDLGLPAGVMHCFGRAMMRDRVTSLRKANIYEPQTYRHFTSALQIHREADGAIRMRSNYLVIRTLTNGDSAVYQAGTYDDVVVSSPEGWRYRSKRAIFDTSRIHTLLAIPV